MTLDDLFREVFVSEGMNPVMAAPRNGGAPEWRTQI